MQFKKEKIQFVFLGSFFLSSWKFHSWMYFELAQEGSTRPDAIQGEEPPAHVSWFLYFEFLKNSLLNVFWVLGSCILTYRWLSGSLVILHRKYSYGLNNFAKKSLRGCPAEACTVACTTLDNDCFFSCVYVLIYIYIWSWPRMTWHPELLSARFCWPILPVSQNCEMCLCVHEFDTVWNVKVLTKTSL